MIKKCFSQTLMLWPLSPTLEAFALESIHIFENLCISVMYLHHFILPFIW